MTRPEAAKRGGARSGAGGKRAGAGRKPKAAADVMRVGSIRLTAAQWAAFRSMGGGAWLRKRLGRGKVTP